MNQPLHPRFKRKPFKNKYAPKVQYVYNFQSAKLAQDGTITMYQRTGTDEYLLDVQEPTKEPVWVKVNTFKAWRNV